MGSYYQPLLMVRGLNTMNINHLPTDYTLTCVFVPGHVHNRKEVSWQLLARTEIISHATKRDLREI